MVGKDGIKRVSERKNHEQDTEMDRMEICHDRIFTDLREECA
jgi:hypothetical protein